MLMLGRATDARDRLKDNEMHKQGHKLGVFDWPVIDPAGQVHTYRLPAYEWLCLWEAAANGDYDRAADWLAEVGARILAEETRLDLPRLHSTFPQVVATEIGVRGRPGFVGIVMQWLREDLIGLYSRTSLLPDERTDLEAVLGVLAWNAGCRGRRNGICDGRGRSARTLWRCR